MREALALLVPGFGIHDRSKSMLKGKNKPYNVAHVYIRQEKTRTHTPHLKFGILSNFAGIGPENRLFSKFLHSK